MTTVDAQFGITRILRPYAGFEANYQGVTVTARPIMLTEGGVALDPQAGQPGYDANLVKGLAVPVGARVMIWIPLVIGSASTSLYAYRWQLTWRLRNVADYRQKRTTPYHFGQQVAGVPNAGSPRFVVPAVQETIIYSETPEPSLTTESASNLRTDITRVVMSPLPRPPINPSGAGGILQQGVFDPAVSATFANRPMFGFLDTTAKGDELMISVDRAGDPYPAGGAGGAQNVWEFASGETDESFSIVLGNGSGTTYPPVGVYVLCGSAP